MIKGFKRFTNNIKILLELAGTPLKIDIETKIISKDFHILGQIDTYLKPSKKKNLMQKARFKF